MYRSIDAAFWTDPAVRALSPEEKLLYFYLISNPHTHLSGIYYLPVSFVIHETGLTESQARKAIDTLSKGSLVEYDGDREVVWVVKMLRHQSTSPKTMVAVAKQLKRVHKSPLIANLLQEYHTLPIPYRYPTDTSLSESESGSELELESELGTTCEDKLDAKSRKTPLVDQGPQTFLADAFIKRRSKEKGESVGDVAAELKDALLIHKIPVETLNHEICTADRALAEPSWELVKRLQKSHGKGKQPKEPDPGMKAALEQMYGKRDA